MKRTLVVLLLITCLLVSGAAGTVAAQEDDEDTTETPEDDSDVWESTTFEHAPGVVLNDIQYEDGDAVISMTADRSGAGESVVITDSSRETSGEMERTRVTLDEGENVFRVELHNPSNEVVTVDAAGRIYLDVGEKDLNLLPTVDYPVVTVLGGGIFALALILGLDLLANRKSKKAFNPLK